LFFQKLAIIDLRMFMYWLLSNNVQTKLNYAHLLESWMASTNNTNLVKRAFKEVVS